MLIRLLIVIDNRPEKYYKVELLMLLSLEVTVGVFIDQWSLLKDGFTPAGCGWNSNNHWTWCPTGHSIGHLQGYLHTNSVSIHGSVMPPQSNQMPNGLIINP